MPGNTIETVYLRWSPAVILKMALSAKKKNGMLAYLRTTKGLKNLFRYGVAIIIALLIIPVFAGRRSARDDKSYDRLFH